MKKLFIVNPNIRRSYLLKESFFVGTTIQMATNYRCIIFVTNLHPLTI
jgi:hypothetical protein